MFIGPIELMILTIPAVVILVILFRAFGGGSKRSNGGGFTMGHTTLTCPHCGKETRAGDPRCEHCGYDL